MANPTCFDPLSLFDSDSDSEENYQTDNHDPDPLSFVDILHLTSSPSEYDSLVSLPFRVVVPTNGRRGAKRGAIEKEVVNSRELTR